MAINLSKIRSDLEHTDPQIQTFALMSIARLSPELVDSAAEIQSVYDRLNKLMGSDNPDVVFLARKATNHVDSVFRPYLRELRAAEGRRKDPKDMGREEILALLDPTTDSKRLSAIVMRFVDVGVLEDLSALTPFLEHDDDRVRSNTVEVFTALGGPEHVDVLRPYLTDRNNRVRGNVIMALVSLGETDVRRPLEEMLCMGMISMRETAVWALSQLDLSFSEELLLRASHDPYDGVRLRATKALRRFVTRQTIVRLKELMNDLDITICEAAVESLRAIKRAHEELRSRTGSFVAPSSTVASPVSGSDPLAQPSIIEPHDVSPTDSSALRNSASEGPSEARQVSVSSEDRRSELLRELGAEVYQMCRLNEVTHEALDNVFYEILRYQDFLRAYMVKTQKTGIAGDVNPRAAVEKLQGRIATSFVELGRVAKKLIEGGGVRVPDERRESVQRIMTELGDD